MPKSGIYHIHHRRTGKTYVGQASDISRRWAKHRRELRLDRHHCFELQQLWTQYGEESFAFSIAKAAPDGLSSLALQRWLASEERQAWADLSARGVCLNSARPEVVATRSAIHEAKKEYATKLKERNAEITDEVRRLGREAHQLEVELRPLTAKLQQTSARIKQVKSTLFWNTGLLGLFAGEVSREAEAKLKEELKVLLSANETLEKQHDALRSKILAMQSQQTHLRRRYPRNAERIVSSITMQPIPRTQYDLSGKSFVVAGKKKTDQE